MLKSSIEAGRHREIGNQLFAKTKYCEALLSYNHSLCFSEENSEDAALAFANRSVVYLKLKEYELCLENIELAKQSGYPRDKIEKLNKREIECKRLMQTYEKDPDDDPLNFFKLSYPANKKLPCLVECLELASNDQNEKCIITNQDLKAGDIIGSTEAAFSFALPQARLHVCNYCIKNSTKLSLIPCSKCSRAMYCSKECMEADSKEFHKLQCGAEFNPNLDFFSNDNDLSSFIFLLHILAHFENDLNKMREFFEQNQSPKTVFDFDLSNKDDPNYKKNLFLTVVTSKGSPVSCEAKKAKLQNLRTIINDYPCLKSVLGSRENKKFLDDFLVQLWDSTFVGNFCKTKLNLEENGQKMQEMTDGWTNNDSAVKFDPYYSLVNHNCFNNMFTRNVDGKTFWIVMRPIKAGEAISRNRTPGPLFIVEKIYRDIYVKCLTGKTKILHSNDKTNQ